MWCVVKKEKIVMEARKMFLVFRGFLCEREKGNFKGLQSSLVDPLA